MTTLVERAQAIRRTFEEGRYRLFREDGSQIYGDAEHAERLAALRTERNRALDEIERGAEQEATSARQDLTAFENGDPTTLLTDSEIEGANARRALVADDVAGLTEEALISRLNAVARSGERVSMFVYLQAGRRRARELVEERLNRRVRNGDGFLEGGAEQEVRMGIPPELGHVLAELQEKLIPDSRKAELETTRSRVKDALDARGIANLARREQKSIYEPPLAVPGPSGAR